jgi:hypothetical protein
MSLLTELGGALGAPKNVAGRGNGNMSGVLPVQLPSDGRSIAVFEMSAGPPDATVK